ncbi:hypothetical protein F7P75_10025 [Acinetobacter gandensis]|uniref:Uncharacterized protein n=1 Tax=Acinetobacter gandensis TaxID=1443941 RepID=A0A1A7R8Y7_9GAMM|nr:hypothetical protein [Acinetobacter gandensis]KAB0625899.1 hypothetical protein F7P75_10025 [Acinetobacter gandensis]OBX27953.1 hypothetical protein A9J31_07450 [Acinetobacter gandensis]
MKTHENYNKPQVENLPLNMTPRDILKDTRLNLRDFHKSLEKSKEIKILKDEIYEEIHTLLLDFFYSDYGLQEEINTINRKLKSFSNPYAFENNLKKWIDDNIDSSKLSNDLDIKEYSIELFNKLMKR